MVASILVNGEQLTNYFGIPVKIAANFQYNKQFPTFIKYDFNGQNPQYNQSSGVDITVAENFDYSEIQNSNNRFYFKLFDNKGISYPVIHFLNLFSNVALNNWSGEANSLTGQQIIAGNKSFNSDNSPRLSGVILGKVQDDTQKEPGVYGYNDNKEIFCVSIDGKLYFNGDFLNIDTSNKKIKIADILEIVNNKINLNIPFKNLKDENNKSLSSQLSDISDEIASLWRAIDNLKNSVTPPESE